MTSSVVPGASPGKRDTFSSRKVFILAAIGSAVGLGNIWRFPYVAYEGGGGAFMIPYAVALLAAGIPFLFLDYAVGHKFRGGPPLAFRRLNKKAEWIGWWQALVCVVIATYYAVILAWAARYIGFSVDHRWGDNPETFFISDFLQVGDPSTLSLQFVPGVLIPLIIVWVACIVIMSAGVDKGIGLLSAVFIPVLVIAFVSLVIIALTLPGAFTGLEAFFTPDWSALTEGSVWMSAIGQIFFSLSVGFGIMITYSSYVDRKTDMTGSGLVVGFANSSFELLAGIGVFAALGFMATAAAVPVDEVVSSGIGLAFIAFPTIISQAPLGSVIGVLFFSSLFIAGITSMVSILEVGISSLREKLGLGRVGGTLAMCLPVAIASCLLLGTTTALPVLDVLDSFVNSFGILAVATIMMLAVTYAFRKLPILRDYLNRHGTFKVGMVWMGLIAVVLPLALLFLLGTDLSKQLAEPYEGYPQWLINTFGWAMAISLPILAIVLSLLPWSKKAHITAKHTYEHPQPSEPDPYRNS
ncbi:MAG: sodium-dependent transporter [Dermatophilus congolensis]|nr:sodium-dependent transporter [Dermatophilus congolensis]